MARLGSIVQMEFTCVLYQFHIPYFLNILHTLNDVHDSWAKEMSLNGLASMNFSEPRHQVVRFVGRAFVIKPVDMQVAVVFMRDTLEASLGNFDVL